MAGHGQPRKGADKRTVCVNTRLSPAEIETIDKANAAEMPGKPRGAYVRYAALKHAATVDTSILELRAERWYYYSRDKYGRETVRVMDGEQRLRELEELDRVGVDPAEWERQPVYFRADQVSITMATKRGYKALAALLRAEAAEQDK